MNVVPRFFAVVALMLTSYSAIADGNSAIRNFFVNLDRAKATIGVKENNVIALPTLMKSMYSISSKEGRFLGYINEEGTLFGDSLGFKVVPPDGTPVRSLKDEEISALRPAMVASIERQKLIKVVYGNAGDNGNTTVEFSAIDCLYCKKLEDRVRKSGKSETVYIVPSSLQDIDQGGMQQWQKVSRIWCSNEPGKAWISYWEKGNIPAPESCPFADPRVAEQSEFHLRSILKGIGINVKGTPALVFPNGTVSSGPK